MNAAQWLAERREEWLQLNHDRNRYPGTLADFEDFADWLTARCVQGNGPPSAIVGKPEQQHGPDTIAPTGALQDNAGTFGRDIAVTLAELADVERSARQLLAVEHEPPEPFVADGEASRWGAHVEEALAGIGGAS